MQTMEKMTKDETIVKMAESQFYGEKKTKEESKENMMLEMVRQRIMMYKCDLDSAKVASYDAKSDNELHWTVKVEKDANVQMIMGKISSLEQLLKDFESIPSSMSTMM